MQTLNELVTDRLACDSPTGHAQSTRFCGAPYLELVVHEGIGLAAHDDDLKRAAKAANVTIF